MLEHCVPRCFPPGASEYTEKMMECAAYCKLKTVETYELFKKVNYEKSFNESSGNEEKGTTNEINPFMDEELANPRLRRVMKDFKVETIPSKLYF